MFQETRIAPVLEVYPSRPGRSGLCLQRTGMMVITRLIPCLIHPVGSKVGEKATAPQSRAKPKNPIAANNYSRKPPLEESRLGAYKGT
jgi:hypothetical protein